MPFYTRTYITQSINPIICFFPIFNLCQNVETIQPSNK